MQNVPLVDVTRGSGALQHVENVHYGTIAVTAVDGRLLCSAGDAAQRAFTRSTLKPLQVLPLLEDAGLGTFGFGARELALMCSSHSGEAGHVAVVTAILERAGLDESSLQCGVHAPLYHAASNEPPPADGRWTALHHNCSGKHAGFLCWCALHDVDRRDYLAFGHPLQERIRDLVARLAGCAPGELAVGIDGCSAPNYSVPLERLAHFYARLAQGAGDAEFGASFEAIFAAMTGHPDLVSGRGRTDLAYMQLAPGDWIAKAGADGVQAFGSRSAGLGIAIKIADGNTRALNVAFIETLAQLGLLEGRNVEGLAGWRAPVIRNHRGLETGRVRPVLRLARGGAAGR